MGRFDVLLNSPTPPPVPQPVAQEKTIPTTHYASLLANQQTSKEEKKKPSKEDNQQISKEVNKHASLPANQFASKTLKKFGSYLSEDSLRRLKRVALETDRKDYEVLQEAVDQYLARTHQQHPQKEVC